MVRPILVTGASGFLGSFVVTELYKAGLGPRVHLLLRSQPKVDSLLGLRFRDAGLDINEVKPRLHFADFTNQEQFSKALAELKNISQEWVVIHLAAIINSQGDTLAQEQVNFDRSKELLEWAHQFGSRFVYTSSVVAFGASPAEEKRTEADYPHYHCLNKIDAYSTSKRKAHDYFIENSRIPTTLLCPGIIHGSYEHQKTSRAHLKMLLEGKLKWAPGGIGAFVTLRNVGRAILESALSEDTSKKVQTKLLNDICLSYREYFELYLECASKNKSHLKTLPSCFVYFVAYLYPVLKIFTKKAALVSKVVQSLLNYNFVTGLSEAEGRRLLKNAIIESLEKRG